jgi:ATP-dependent Clp protease ATP-binding subunit ClpA
LNRIDDIIVFNPLGEDVVKKIVEVLLQDVEKRLEARNIKVSFSENLKKHLMEV